MLTSESTLPEVQAAFDNNADYDIEASVPKCKLFIQACRVLLRRMTEQASSGDVMVQDRYQKIENQLLRAVEWWQANDPNAAPSVHKGGARYLGFSNKHEWRT